jgi:uncharacterized C2H2 Zn-finger protein
MIKSTIAWYAARATDIFSCPLCETTFRNYTQLSIHLAQIHKKLITAKQHFGCEVYVCKDCSMSWIARRSYQTHTCSKKTIIIEASDDEDLIEVDDSLSVDSQESYFQKDRTYPSDAVISDSQDNDDYLI